MTSCEEEASIALELLLEIMVAEVVATDLCGYVTVSTIHMDKSRMCINYPDIPFRTCEIELGHGLFCLHLPQYVDFWTNREEVIQGSSHIARLP